MSFSGKSWFPKKRRVDIGADTRLFGQRQPVTVEPYTAHHRVFEVSKQTGIHIEELHIGRGVRKMQFSRKCQATLQHPPNHTRYTVIGGSLLYTQRFS